ncbi:peptidase M50B-like-domain-containing protein [Cyathus striatus]|nr:peptidase M50B-like-domain-containing protein [Cyathus striatus]
MATITRPPIAPPMSSVTSVPTSPLQPSGDQVVVLYVIIAMAVVIFGFWNVPVVRNCINPLKLFTIGWHELCHITAAILSGGRILKITIDPHVGGATIVEGGRPTFILSAGYIGSTLLGGAFILAGWDTLVAKILSFVLGVGLIMPLVLVRDKLTILLTFCYEGLMIGFWFVDHGQALRWYCLFIGVMNILFVICTCLFYSSHSPYMIALLGDVADDRFFHKTNDSDATQFSILYPRIGAHLWATFWIIFQLGMLAGFALLGIYVFKVPDDAGSNG